VSDEERTVPDEPETESEATVEDLEVSDEDSDAVSGGQQAWPSKLDPGGL
jgi:hypothetical protein